MAGQGFPQLPIRQSFGPTYRDVEAVRDPVKELAAGEVNLTAWQSTIQGALAPSVVLRGQDTGGGWEIDYAAFAFDPYELLPNPTAAANGNAQEVTFDIQYPNEQDELRRFVPMVAHAFPTYADTTDQDAGTPRDIVTYINGQIVGVEFRTLGSTSITAEPAIILVWGVSA